MELDSSLLDADQVVTRTGASKVGVAVKPGVIKCTSVAVCAGGRRDSDRVLQVTGVLL